ncbi:response regulator [Bradyrhizobium sp. CB2312]|uniref:response regulator transcription factor n=1 Tax=Bradyrhizobium sp. CB2312 TaxID=3039155 RepID=UPI0024B0DB09|nr:response regulator [Bradyrhizobium sp. CB2312]WFU75526.1 response regulator [Bradyrhizobium sp. CB2312]
MAPVIKKIVGVLDDDPSALNAAGVLLTALEFDVILFASADDFRRNNGAASIDCLLLDIQLGSMSGIDFRRELKGSHPNLPVIFVTGLDGEAACREARDAGCSGFLRKPFEARLLAETIRRATGS